MADPKSKPVVEVNDAVTDPTNIQPVPPTSVQPVANPKPKGVKVQPKGPEGQIVDVGEKPKINGSKVDNQIILKEDIWERFYALGSKQPSYRLLYSKDVPLNPSVLDED